ncbi:MAG: hypothetical protein ACLFNB_03880 [Candidatus Woesearchaeota archaeon]
MRRGEIYNLIVGVLKTENLNIQQISQRTGIRWETVRNAVESLEEAGFLKRDGREFKLDGEFQFFDEETILGVPIDENQKKEYFRIAKRIREFKDYNKTFLQKAVINVIKKENLDLPYGWYLFGECTPVKLGDETLQGYGSTRKYDKAIRETINEFGHYNNTVDLMEDHYQDKPVYAARLHIDQIFKGELTRNSMKQIELLVKQMLFKVNEPASEYLDAFLSNVAMLKRLDDEELESIKLDIFSTFRIIWELIGTQQFKESSGIDNIDFYYETRMTTLKSLASEYLANLKDYWPEPEFSEHIKKMQEKYKKKS